MARFYPEGMGKTWVLHTETKGTGAQMVPLEQVTKRSGTSEPVFVPRTPSSTPEPPAPEPRRPHRFTVIDLMTRQTLAEDASARETVDVLSGVASVVDVNVYVWQEEQSRWRLLTLGEQRALWDLSRRAPTAEA
jgi:hypothetical protein